MQRLREGIWLECFQGSFQLPWGNIYFLEGEQAESQSEREAGILASIDGLDHR